MITRIDLTQLEGWIIYNPITGEVYRFDSFKEALTSPKKGHVMSEYYYNTDYRFRFDKAEG